MALEKLKERVRDLPPAAKEGTATLVAQQEAAMVNDEAASLEVGIERGGGQDWPILNPNPEPNWRRP